MSRWSSSTHEGGKLNDWYEGEGKYHFPDGEKFYEGQFHRGEFHGKGALVYKNGGRFEATWERGVAAKGEYVFSDGLVYEDKEWGYSFKT